MLTAELRKAIVAYKEARAERRGNAAGWAHEVKRLRHAALREELEKALRTAQDQREASELTHGSQQT